jgi:predicted  nucleic acid-binding Zn-ribbon protein
MNKEFTTTNKTSGLDKLEEESKQHMTNIAALTQKVENLEKSVDKIEINFNQKFDKITDKVDSLNLKMEKYYYGILGAIIVPLILHFIK